MSGTEPRTDRWRVPEMAAELADFIEDATGGPWRPEPLTDGEGLQRRRSMIWLNNDFGDSLAIDEDTASMLVNVVRLLRAVRLTEGDDSALAEAEAVVRALPGTQDNDTYPRTPEDEYVERSAALEAIASLRKPEQSSAPEEGS